MKNLERVQEVVEQLKKIKLKVSIDNVMNQSLFSVGGTLTDNKEIYNCLAIIQAAEEHNTPDYCVCLDKHFFKNTFNLVKEDVLSQLFFYINLKLDLENKKITPGSVIGKGYVNPRKIAFSWINRKIFSNYYLFTNFDQKNIFTNQQIATTEKES